MDRHRDSRGRAARASRYLSPVNGVYRNQNAQSRSDLVRTPAPTAPGSTLPDTKPERSSTGFAACPDGLPVRSCFREAMALAASPASRMPAVRVSAMPPPCAASDRPRPHATLGRSDSVLLAGHRNSRRPELSGYAGFPAAILSPFPEAALACPMVMIAVFGRGMVGSPAGTPASERPLTVIRE